jgi:arylsulfatase A-like enzyme
MRPAPEDAALKASGSRVAGLGLAVAVALACADAGEGERGDAPPRRSLILVSIDTLRADRLGAYGYGRETSPTLDALARRGVRFETVIAESAWTLPSHMTLFTGLPPTLHGVVSHEWRLAAAVPTLAELLQAHGYRTFAFTGGLNVAPNFGFGRGFEVYASAMQNRESGEMEPIPFRSALALASRRIGKLAPDAPFFAFVHTYDVHCPYDPPAEYAERFDSRPPEDRIETRDRCGTPDFNAMALTPGQAAFLSDRYDASIRYADDLLGDFLEALRGQGVLDRSFVVVLSDHGEEFLEHGRIGHQTLYIECLRVPWIIAGPGLEPRVVRDPVGLADVMPTLLALLEVPAPPTDGLSRLAAMRGPSAAAATRPRFSELGSGPDLRSAVLGRHHLIASPEATRLFDWHADPKEQRDLSGVAAGPGAELERALAQWSRHLASSPLRSRAELLPELSAEQKEQLRALGYAP